MTKKRTRKTPVDGNGPTQNFVPPPMSDDEFAEIVAQFKKRGLPLILYVFNGQDSIRASRLIQDAGPRQIAAVATELDEWARSMTRSSLAAMFQQRPKVAKAGILTPDDLKGIR